MPRLTRQPLVALLAALAALLAPAGATAAGPVAVAARQSAVGGAAGAAHTTSQPPVGRVTAGRELRDTAARRAQYGSGADVSTDAGAGADAGAEAEVEVGSTVASGGHRVSHHGPAPASAGALVAVALLLTVAWWVRRSRVDTALVGRTTGIRSGRGPPALACA
jgi:hypothetical protein